jgi:hypothetical protein
MKKLTATFHDNASIDVASIIAVAIDFKIETITQERPSGPKPSRHLDRTTSVPKTLMDHFTPEGIFTVDQAEKWVADKGYNAKSSSSALHLLTHSRHIRRLGKGKFQFLKPLSGA